MTQKCYIVFISSGDKNLLYESLEIYKFLILNPNTKDDVFELAANKSIGILSKLEKEVEILTILIKMVRRFPKNYNYKKELGLEYRKRGNDAVATKIFEEILPDQNDTLVMAHLGKICVCFVASACDLKTFIKNNLKYYYLIQLI